MSFVTIGAVKVILSFGVREFISFLSSFIFLFGPKSL